MSKITDQLTIGDKILNLIIAVVAGGIIIIYTGYWMLSMAYLLVISWDLIILIVLLIAAKKFGLWTEMSKIDFENDT